MSTEIIKFEELSKAPEILSKNKQAIERAKQAGLELLGKIQQTGMNENVDAECNDYLIKLKKQVEIINERRKPITQLLDAVKKEFTSIESELNPKDESTVYYKIQAYRDQFAKQKLEQQRKKEEEALKAKAIEDEKIEVAHQITIALSDYINNHMEAEFKILQGHFNGITLQNIDEKSKIIADYPSIYNDKHYQLFTLNIPTKHLTNEEKKVLKQTAMNGNIERYSAMFHSEIYDFKKALLDKIPSKKAELERIAHAELENAEMVQKLKEAQIEREKANNAKIEKEANDRKLQAEKEANAKTETLKMQSLFDSQAAIVDPKANVQERTGYKMVITHQTGYMQIFAFWFENEGKTMSLDAIEKKTMLQMKSFCEKHAHKNESFIESKFIKYEEIVKVRAKV